ncbi:hypothetical protein DFH08DRAFT_1084983 [Mycena albidolilacea]|uniref:Uncharacterized protein n=1 Tax=Mycena albidolilacea TaxID=1033008 RepID=A0AAD7EIJ1_9AGAR|nr:hypothetical protein DFH08DRAFT_1084983 [Mycena albidolilacea]
MKVAEDILTNRSTASGPDRNHCDYFNNARNPPGADGIYSCTGDIQHNANNQLDTNNQLNIVNARCVGPVFIFGNRKPIQRSAKHEFIVGATSCIDKHFSLIDKRCHRSWRCLRVIMFPRALLYQLNTLL